MRSGVRPALRRGLRLAALALTLAAGGALAQETLEVRLQAPDELRPLLERHVRLLRQEALALPEEPADRSAMTQRARREVAGLLATEGYFSPRVRFDRSDARDWLLEVEPGPRTEIAQVELQFVGEIATSGPGGSAYLDLLRAD